jgi:hypothetical protein
METTMTDVWYMTKEWYEYFNNLMTVVSNQPDNDEGIALLKELRRLSADYHSMSLRYTQNDVSDSDLESIKDSFNASKAAIESWVESKNITE